MDRYLKGIRESRRDILQEVYNNNYPPIRNFVMQNGGDIEDSKDVFQDVMMSLYRTLEKRDIFIKTSFNTYIYSIGKFVWFKKLKEKKHVGFLDITTVGDVVEESYQEEMQYQLFAENLKNLGDDCQRVLNYYFEGKSFDQISILMKYKSDGFARRKKYLCKNYLMKLIQSDPRYNEILN